MKRKLITATMATMMMVSSAVPAMAMVGAEKPENPDMMVITAIEQSVEQRPTAKVLPAAEPVLYTEPVAEPVLYAEPVAEPVLYAEPVAQPVPEAILYNEPAELEKEPKVEKVETVEHYNSLKYLVKKGDTLWKIVKKALKTEDVSQIHEGVKKIVDTNNLENPDMIYTGDSLDLPAGL